MADALGAVSTARVGTTALEGRLTWPEISSVGSGESNVVGATTLSLLGKTRGQTANLRLNPDGTIDLELGTRGFSRTSAAELRQVHELLSAYVSSRGNPAIEDLRKSGVVPLPGVPFAKQPAVYQFIKDDLESQGGSGWRPQRDVAPSAVEQECAERQVDSETWDRVLQTILTKAG